MDFVGMDRIRVDRPVGVETFQLDGTVLSLRRVVPEDRVAVVEMHGRCSQQSLRYLGAVARDLDWPVLAMARRLGYAATPHVEGGFMDLEIDGATLPSPRRG